MIEQYSFGNIVINGVSYRNDVKIIQGKVVPEWWRKRGHFVDVDDIQDILKSKPDILVLGKGSPGQMKSTEALRKFLKKNGIELIEEKSSKAFKTFNRLFNEGKNVSAGFHLTC
ncbi:MAG: hypothetical protein JRF31_13405 [Deltaproteobacteria bacterium]|nr:hypothetical protein [Deltaproteobacteria bacterium]MBW2013926.1 hypothetical protein [Deltaproteobacteria bacterium]MBW2087880.1 hypothetical protein [Deltaproteobacteria bacterium]MBW2321794.1 hypothetical protein [Deltaproteobacteria bacterium]